MNKEIKILEEIGQSTSINEHDSLTEMLASVGLKDASIENISLKTQDFVCMLFPQDDKNDDEKEDNKDNEEKEDTHDQEKND